MLVSKKLELESGKIYTFKMTNGEEAIGKLISHDDEAICVEKPRQLVATQSGGMSLAPSLIMGDPDESVIFYKTSVMAVTKPSCAMNSAYEKSSSKIVTPDKNIVTP